MDDPNATIVVDRLQMSCGTFFVLMKKSFLLPAGHHRDPADLPLFLRMTECAKQAALTHY
ncbi:hypothetical protein VQ03_10160 [Methylobacterium tarhaniae]|uniref:Uncharacterized protein n=1 Tax=Methylobacterium tarhaniae TaxID=1187852 RepID=A0A0J6T9Y8_9HYPH|nr:hypothetical protein [Methylobacterium tarhaniae]KMO42704.1 hypothetical protein VQ03_10160 [Methylobacterium tarhaniae]